MSAFESLSKLEHYNTVPPRCKDGFRQLTNTGSYKAGYVNDVHYSAAKQIASLINAVASHSVSLPSKEINERFAANQ